MAKRKRLEIPNEALIKPSETNPVRPTHGRMPIAEVAGDTAARAALDEVSQAMATAEAEGRVVRKLAMDSIEVDHLNRDRMVLDPDEMAALTASLTERGQQTPIEVLSLSKGRFGLISGLRRFHALRAMGMTEVLAFVRKPEGAAASYVAMVEENEIRAGLSFYERANIAVQAVGAGVYPDVRAAVKGLFAHVPAAKRSKILRFVVLREALGRQLQFPTAIPEKLGLALATAIEADKSIATRLSDALRKTPPADAAAERRVLERPLKAPVAPPSSPEEIAPGVTLKAGRGKLTLSGPAVDAGFEAALLDWIRAR
ncbi:ParB N-terminal domain-containing protein [uncultured Roseobacter sp.]|uniref:ParB N-terminal domain-containing protein n=1 Tax=uncultured Roseobacter sp. TaxID=114847 RepID=UPI002615D4F7|nr:ParB N-terminal domain-containing protein [uncultured Roseobacter sp.]